MPTRVCIMVIMNKLNIQKRVQILSCLIEGNSIRSTARITDTSKNTVTKLLCDLGAACAKYQDERLRNLTCKRLQCDEIGVSATQKRKMCLKIRRVSLVMVTFGPGPQ